MKTPEIRLHAVMTPLVFLALFTACNTSKTDKEAGNNLKIQVTNTLEMERLNTLVAVDLSQLDTQAFADFDKLAVFNDQAEIPSQHSDGKLLFIVDTLGRGSIREFSLKQVEVKTTFPKRSQAELSIKQGGHFENRKYIGGDFVNIDSLRVPPEHTDHSFFIRYEGPGWESDMVGYRFYLDWRNATDAFGKKTGDMVLQNVGLDGFDSYHEMQPWGMDVLKVGKSLGVGTLALYYNNTAERVANADSTICVVQENGDLYSAIKTLYYGWKVGSDTLDVESILSIHAGTRLTHHELVLSGGNPQNLCTGIVKDSNARLFTDQGNESQWGYIATFGPQSLNNDHLGLAVFFSAEAFRGFTEDEFSHIVKLGSAEGMLDYYFLATWELEKNGFTDEAGFMNFVERTAAELANPATVTILK